MLAHGYDSRVLPELLLEVRDNRLPLLGGFAADKPNPYVDLCQPVKGCGKGSL